MSDRKLVRDVAVNVVATLIAAGLVSAASWAIAPDHRRTTIGILLTAFTLTGCLFIIPAFFRREYIALGALFIGLGCFMAATSMGLSAISGDVKDITGLWIAVGLFALMGVSGVGLGFSDEGVHPAIADIRRHWRRIRPNSDS
jgi:hypothetical protein